VRGRVTLTLHESQYEGPPQKKAQVVGDYRACCVDADFLWGDVLDLCKADSIVNTKQHLSSPYDEVIQPHYIENGRCLLHSATHASPPLFVAGHAFALS
jgi:hypothetical protein